MVRPRPGVVPARGRSSCPGARFPGECISVRPGRVRARALRAVRYLAPWSGAGPLAVCSLFVALEIEQMIAWLFEKTAHRLGVSIDASVFRVSGAVTPLFYGLCAFALVHEVLQLRALRILGREDDDRRRAAAAVGRAGIQIA